MEKQVQEEYKSNLELIRADIAEKNKEVEKRQLESEQLKKQLKGIREQQRDDTSFENYKIALYEEKIVQLQAQCGATRESEQKMNDLLHELT